MGSKHKSYSIEKAFASFVEVSTNGLKYHTWDIRKRNDPYGSGLIPKNQSDRIHQRINSLGPLEITVQVANVYSFYCLITHNQILIIPNLQLDKLKETFQVLKYY
ncbi:hypothetical protein Lal_00030084 [Lupinus albus]|nr:hypothetical protein Lal_00030084 [Lupinus albus]